MSLVLCCVVHTVLLIGPGKPAVCFFPSAFSVLPPLFEQPYSTNSWPIRAIYVVTPAVRHFVTWPQQMCNLCRRQRLEAIQDGIGVFAKSFLYSDSDQHQIEAKLTNEWRAFQFAKPEKL